MHSTNALLNISLENISYESLSRISSNVNCPPESIVSMIIDTIFEDIYEDKNAKEGKLRRSLRRNTDIPCVLKFSHSVNEMTYTTASIVNLALGGIGISIGDEHRSREPLVRKTKSFEVTVQMQNEHPPISFNCRTCYVYRNGSLRVGGALIAPEISTLRNFFKVFMHPNPSAISAQ